MFDHEVIAKIQNQFQYSDEVLQKIYQQFKAIKESFCYNELQKEKEYILLWWEPFMGAPVRIALYHREDTGWFLRSDVWRRNPESIITPLLDFDEEKTDDWIVDFVVKYKLYESDKTLEHALMNHEL